MLEAVAAEIDRRADEFIDAEVHDTGKPRALASHLDIPRGAANFRAFADMVKNVPTECFETPTPDGPNGIELFRARARGVVGVLPLESAVAADDLEGGPGAGLRKHGGRKAVGGNPGNRNASGRSDAVSGRSSGVFNVVHGLGEGSTGELLANHPGIAAITLPVKRGPGKRS